MKSELDLIDARNEGMEKGAAHLQAKNIKLTAKVFA